MAIRILEAPQRALVRGPTFIRLLARLTEGDVPPSHPSLADRLSQWIDWTRAVALSRVLDDAPSAPAFGGPRFDDIEDLACLRTRQSLAEAIAAGPPAIGAAAPGADGTVDFAPFRQHYLAMQRSMQIATGQLRGRLRDMLATLSADMARLADVDALMELVLSPREHALLAAVPTLLGEHFERQRAAAQPVVPPADAGLPDGGASDDDAPPADVPSGDATVSAPSTAWLDAFHRDMQGVLHAELDVRFLPIEALLATLRTHSQGRHVQTSA